VESARTFVLYLSALKYITGNTIIFVWRISKSKESINEKKINLFLLEVSNYQISMMKLIKKNSLEIAYSK
jgi:hypothetical protein